MAAWLSTFPHKTLSHFVDGYNDIYHAPYEKTTVIFFLLQFLFTQIFQKDMLPIIHN